MSSVEDVHVHVHVHEDEGGALGGCASLALGFAGGGPLRGGAVSRRGRGADGAVGSVEDVHVHEDEDEGGGRSGWYASLL